MIYLQYSVILIVIANLGYISWTDIQHRIISNKSVLILIPLIVIFSLLTYSKLFFLPALVTFVIGYVLFVLKVVGGGDVKLISVLMLAVPEAQVLSFLFLTSFYGLVLIIIGYLFFRKSIVDNGLPYGVAISFGFLTNLVLFLV